MPKPHLSDLLALHVPRLIHRQVGGVVRLLFFVVWLVEMCNAIGSQSRLRLVRRGVITAMLDHAEELVKIHFFILSGGMI